MAEAYKDDLAYIHDVGFGDYARNSAPGLLEILRQAGITTGLVVDLGCGSGLWARELAGAGYDVLGIDISAAMIDIARKRVLQGEFKVASLLKAKLPQCAAVTSLGECLNYLFDKNNTRHELRRLFRRVYAALKQGGLFIFDVAEPGRGKGPRQKHLEGPNRPFWLRSMKTLEPIALRVELLHSERSANSSGAIKRFINCGFTDGPKFWPNFVVQVLRFAVFAAMEINN